MGPGGPLNPFPGLRPFEPNEEHLFFGREKQTDELLRRLRSTRFLAVIGSSGSGKSSLARSGLIPSLHSGMMAQAGSSWRIALFRPGGDPIGKLASALTAPSVLGVNKELPEATQVLMDVTLRRSGLGLVTAIGEARLPRTDNLLIVVDQFEELFRFRNLREYNKRSDDAAAFVKLLLNAAQRETSAIYVVLTMRSDFVGDCMQYAGLPEAVNAGMYLVPRMTRDELRSAITGPIAVGGGVIEPRLVSRLLNDAGDDPEQLPVLQHALMRTWDYWAQHCAPGEPIDMKHYEAIGTMASALSRHAEEAYDNAVADGYGQLAERIFKALTDKTSDNRGVRRPAPVAELARIAGRGETEVVSVVEIFRRPGRSFLTPPPPVALDHNCVIDLSHESLMRLWTRLAGWADQDRHAAEGYLRISRAATWYEEKSGDLLSSVDLDNALRWRRETTPTAAWAERIAPGFEKAMAFLDRSEQERNRQRAKRRRARLSLLATAWAMAGVLAVLLVIALRSRAQAQQRLAVARAAVNLIVDSAGTETIRVAAEVPQVETFRRRLLEKASDLFNELKEAGAGEDALRAHARLGDIHGLLNQHEKAIAEYTIAIDGLRRLQPDSPEIRELTADTSDRMGFLEASLDGHHDRAEKAYAEAISLFRTLHQQYPGNHKYQLELARALDNRGNLHRKYGHLNRAAADHAEARHLLDGLPSSAEQRQQLARVCNNSGLVSRELENGLAQARDEFENAVKIGSSLAQDDPDDWDYQLELGRYRQNLAIALFDLGQGDPAENQARQALAIFEKLARPAPYLQIALAQTHDILAQVLESGKRLDIADAEYGRALDLFRNLSDGPIKTEDRIKFGNVLFDAALAQIRKGAHQEAIQLLLEAAKQHAGPGSETYLAWDYLNLAKTYEATRESAEANEYYDKAAALLPKIPEIDRDKLGVELSDFARNRH